MANINLLPWREYKREHEKKAFIRLLSLAAIAGFCLSFLFYYYTSRLVVAQNMRNEKLNQQIITLDKKIKEISSIRQRKNRLVARMKAIQILQAKRTLTIHLFDELLNVLPDGVYLTEFKREKEKITLTGYTESNSDISLLMRNIQNDPWIENPDLTEIKKNNQVNNAVNNEFHLSFVLQGTKPEKVAPK